VSVWAVAVKCFTHWAWHLTAKVWGLGVGWLFLSGGAPQGGGAHEVFQNWRRGGDFFAIFRGCARFGPGMSSLERYGGVCIEYNSGGSPKHDFIEDVFDFLVFVILENPFPEIR
jgi:hypothetical protein